MNYKGYAAIFALFLLLSVVAVTAQQAPPNLGCGASCTVNVRFAPSSDGERVEMDGVSIGEKESTYVSSNLMVFKALGPGYAGSTASVPNQFTSTGATIQIRFAPISEERFYYVSQVNRQSVGDPFAGKQPVTVSWEKPLLPSQNWVSVSTDGDTAVVPQGQDIHVITNGNLQLPATFTVYSSANDQAVASTTISNAQTDCSSPNQRCSATISTGGLSTANYYVTFSPTATISNPMNVKIGTPPVDSGSSFVVKDAVTGEAKTFSTTTVRVNKDLAAGTIAGTDLKFYVWKNGNSPGISWGEIKTNAVYTMSSLGLTFTVDTDWSTYTKLIFSNGKVIDLKLVDGKIKVDTPAPGDWGSGISATVNADGSLVLSSGGTTTPTTTSKYNHTVFVYDQTTSKPMTNAKITYGVFTQETGVTGTKTVLVGPDGSAIIELDKGSTYSVLVEAPGFVGDRYTTDGSKTTEIRKSIALVKVVPKSNITIGKDITKPPLTTTPCKDGKPQKCTVIYNETVKLYELEEDNTTLPVGVGGDKVKLPDGRIVELISVQEASTPSGKNEAAIRIYRETSSAVEQITIPEGETRNFKDGVEITHVVSFSESGGLVKQVRVQIILTKCECLGETSLSKKVGSASGVLQTGEAPTTTPSGPEYTPTEEKPPEFIPVMNTEGGGFVTVTFLDKGWNLKSFEGEPEKMRTTCKKPIYGFIHIPGRGQVSMDEALKILGKDGLKKYLGRNAFLIKSDEKCTLESWIKLKIDIELTDLVSGPNFLRVTEGMKGKSIDAIEGSCDVESVYNWPGQGWVGFSDKTTMTENEIGNGLLINVKNSCTLGVTELPNKTTSTTKWEDIKYTEKPKKENATEKKEKPLLFESWENIKFTEVPKENTDEITCQKDGKYFKDSVNSCRAQGGAVQECMPPIATPKGPLTTSAPRVLQNYSPNINLRTNWGWLSNLTRDVNRTGVANNTYNATSFDCDDFADGLEKGLTAMGYNATFTYINCWDGVNASSVWAHAITDVHAPNGDTVFIEPQDESIQPMDKDGDGVVEVRRNHPQDGSLHETDDHCMIDVYDSKEDAEAHGVVMD